MFLQRLDRRDLGDTDRRSRAEDDCVRQGDGHGKRKDLPVDRQIQRDRDDRGRELCNQRAAAPLREREPGDGPGAREHDTFDQQLSRQTPPPRAERQSHAQFTTKNRITRH